MTTCILSEHNTIKLELNNKSRSKNTQMEAEQHIAQQSVNHRRYMGGNQNVPGI
jgi:hypothetical protein